MFTGTTAIIIMFNFNFAAPNLGYYKALVLTALFFVLPLVGDICWPCLIVSLSCGQILGITLFFFFHIVIFLVFDTDKFKKKKKKTKTKKHQLQQAVFGGS